jgi:prepilin-type N-terminal cleavage/methylation domain-containing protein/prepilin-type processing-associated H-X9-DG protein
MTSSLKKRFLLRQRRRSAFTLVELLAVIGIIALLGSLTLPNFQMLINKAKSTQCDQQLHGIGIAVLSAATDNDDTFPEINQAAAPIYGPEVLGLVGTLGKYGVTTNTIQCPVDMAMGATSSFALYGSSYEWNPVLDDGTDPVTTIALGPIPISVNASRIRICTDFQKIHNAKTNALYGDGHTRLR